MSLESVLSIPPPLLGGSESNKDDFDNHRRISELEEGEMLEDGEIEDDEADVGTSSQPSGTSDQQTVVDESPEKTAGRSSGSDTKHRDGRIDDVLMRMAGEREQEKNHSQRDKRRQRRNRLQAKKKEIRESALSAQRDFILKEREVRMYRGEPTSDLDELLESIDPDENGMQDAKSKPKKKKKKKKVVEEEPEEEEEEIEGMDPYADYIKKDEDDSYRNQHSEKGWLPSPPSALQRSPHQDSLDEDSPQRRRRRHHRHHRHSDEEERPPRSKRKADKQEVSGESEDAAGEEEDEEDEEDDYTHLLKREMFLRGRGPAPSDAKKKRRGDRKPPRPRERRERKDRSQEKKSVCKYFMEGKCNKGRDCPFSHDVIPPRKLELCKFFLSDQCMKGKHCIYMHDDYPCRYFHTNGECFQKNCRFSHEPLTAEGKLVLGKLLESEEHGSERDRHRDRSKKPSLLPTPPSHVLEEMKEKEKQLPSLLDLDVKPTTMKPPSFYKENDSNLRDKRGDDGHDARGRGRSGRGRGRGSRGHQDGFFRHQDRGWNDQSDGDFGNHTGGGFPSPEIRNQGPGMNQGSGLNQGPGHMNQGLGLMNQGPGPLNQGPGPMNQGPGPMNRVMGSLNQGPGQMNQNPGLMNQGTRMMNQGPGLMNQGPGIMNQGPGNMLNLGPGIMNQLPSLMNQTPGLMNQVPRIINQGPRMPNQGLGLPNANLLNNQALLSQAAAGLLQGGPINEELRLNLLQVLTKGNAGLNQTTPDQNLVQQNDAEDGKSGDSRQLNDPRQRGGNDPRVPRGKTTHDSKQREGDETAGRFASPRSRTDHLEGGPSDRQKPDTHDEVLANMPVTQRQLFLRIKQQQQLKEEHEEPAGETPPGAPDFPDATDVERMTKDAAAEWYSESDEDGDDKPLTSTLQQPPEGIRDDPGQEQASTPPAQPAVNVASMLSALRKQLNQAQNAMPVLQSVLPNSVGTAGDVDMRADPRAKKSEDVDLRELAFAQPSPSRRDKRSSSSSSGVHRSSGTERRPSGEGKLNLRLVDVINDRDAFRRKMVLKKDADPALVNDPRVEKLLKESPLPSNSLAANIPIGTSLSGMPTLPDIKLPILNDSKSRSGRSEQRRLSGGSSRHDQKTKSSSQHKSEHRSMHGEVSPPVATSLTTESRVPFARNFSEMEIHEAITTTVLVAKTLDANVSHENSTEHEVQSTNSLQPTDVKQTSVPGGESSSVKSPSQDANANSEESKPVSSRKRKSSKEMDASKDENKSRSMRYSSPLAMFDTETETETYGALPRRLAEKHSSSSPGNQSPISRKPSSAGGDTTQSQPEAQQTSAAPEVVASKDSKQVIDVPLPELPLSDVFKSVDPTASPFL